MIYAAYGPRTTEAEARAAFAARYGVEPQVVKKHNVWLLGPKPEGGRDEANRYRMAEDANGGIQG